EVHDIHLGTEVNSVRGGHAGLRMREDRIPEDSPVSLPAVVPVDVSHLRQLDQYPSGVRQDGSNRNLQAIPGNPGTLAVVIPPADHESAVVQRGKQARNGGAGGRVAGVLYGAVPERHIAFVLFVRGHQRLAYGILSEELIDTVAQSGAVSVAAGDGGGSAPR